MVIDRVELRELLEVVDGFRDYESNWDPDDPSVSEETISSAKALITRVFEECGKRGIDGRRPGVSVDPCARIDVSWGKRRDVRALWFVEGALSEPVVLVTSRPGGEPVRAEAPAEAAVEAALEALCAECGEVA